MSVAAYGADAAPPARKPVAKPRIGLALSAGAARGLAQVGVLKALEENGIQIDFIAGTSMGAVIGALYASGYSADQVEHIVRSIEWQHVFSSRPERPLVPLTQRIDTVPAVGRFGIESWKFQLPRSIDSDYRINRLLTKVLTGPELAAGRDFDRLPIPFRAVAADLKTGERVVLSRGNLARAVRASSSVPVSLMPVEDGERLLVDGGIVDDFPIGVVRAMGADVVIAVDTRLPPLPPERYRDIIGMAAQLVDVLAKNRNAAFAEDAEITIAPDLKGIGPWDYGKFESAMTLGHESVMRVMEEIRQRTGEGRVLIASDTGTPSDSLAVTDDPDPDLAKHVGASQAEGEVVESVRVDGNRSVGEGLIREIFGIRPGLPFDLDSALRGIDALHATRLFESIWLDVEPTTRPRHPGRDYGSANGSGLDVTIHLTEAWRWTAEIGASYDESDRVGVFLRLLTLNLRGSGENFDLTTMASDSNLGARVRLSSDRFLGDVAGFFVRAHVLEDKPRVFRAHDFVGRTEFDRTGGDTGLQWQLGSAALLRAGIGIERIRTELKPGVEFPAARDRIASLQASAVWDRLDDRSFPTGGGAAEVLAEESRLRDLETSATRDYRRIIFLGRSAFSMGRRNIVDAQLLLGGSGGDVPVYKLIRIGGPLIPGLHREELWGHQAAAAGIAHSLIFWRKLRLTVRAGAGNVWGTRESVSLRNMRSGLGVGIEYPTKRGPLSLMWGRSDSDESHLYFTAGFQQTRQD